MAEKKKAYRRFEELAKNATAPIRAESDTVSPVSPPAEITIRLSPEIRRALEQQAAADNTTPSELIEEALRRYLLA